MSMVLGAKTAIAAAVDAYFNLVTLLLPGDGTNGAQNNTFLDSSSNNFTITRNGNTTQGTFSPFSQTGWSNYFNGSTDYFNFAAQSGFSFGTGDWAIETFVYLTSTADQAIYDARPTSTNGLYPLVDTAGGKFRYYTNSASRIESNSTFSANTWYHLVVSRVSGTTRMFIDGVVQSTTYTDSNNYIVGTNRPTIGIGGFNLTGPLSGYLSNMRVLKGSGYTSVTVPTAPLTAVTNTQLLICQSNRFVDNSANAYAITITGTPSVQAFSPFAPTAAYSASTNGGSGYFDGTGDYLTVGTAADWTFLHNTTAAWTMEFWVYNTTTGSATTLLDTNASTTGSTGVTVQKTASEFINVFITYSSAGNNIVNGTSNITLKANAWNHVFISYNQSLANTNLVFYINGAAAGTANKTANTPSSGNPANALSIATYGAGAGQFFPGYIGSLRISNTVRSTPSSVPTSPYTSDANTKLLANFTNAGITDATAKNDLETVGNAQISTTQSKFGGSSIYLDGVGDYCALRSNQDLILGSGDFTIECWLYPESQPGAYNAIVGGNATGQPLLSLRGSGTSSSIGFNAYGSADVFNISYTFTQNTWVHIAVSRSGTNLRLFINGTQTGSTVTNSTNFSGAITTVGVADNGNYLLKGYIDDLRITRFARYTSNFTAPTAAFALQ
jgi:hypothetical protein